MNYSTPTEGTPIMPMTDGIHYRVMYQLKDGSWETWGTYCYLVMAAKVAARVKHHDGYRTLVKRIEETI
jgi:hypothetical protein